MGADPNTFTTFLVTGKNVVSDVLLAKSLLIVSGMRSCGAIHQISDVFFSQKRKKVVWSLVVVKWLWYHPSGGLQLQSFKHKSYKLLLLWFCSFNQLVKINR